jgi:membrane protease YdiL (CAAX protease family)
VTQFGDVTEQDTATTATQPYVPGWRKTVHVSHCWTIPFAVSVGVVLLLTTGIILYFFTFSAIYRHLLLGWTAFPRNLLTAAITTLVTSLVIWPFAVAVARKRGLNWWECLEWNANRSALIGAAVGTVLGFAGELIEPGQFQGYPLAVTLGLAVVSLGLIQPAFEEMYFRGVLFLALSRRLGDVIAIVAVTVVFAWVHPGHRLAVLPVSVALGIVRLKTRSLAACFALHAAYTLSIVGCELLIGR